MAFDARRNKPYVLTIILNRIKSVRCQTILVRNNNNNKKKEPKRKYDNYKIFLNFSICKTFNFVRNKENIPMIIGIDIGGNIIHSDRT